MGTRVAELLDGIPDKDHPHAYGDKGGIIKYLGSYPGSSPRVWGQEDGEGIHAHLLRIIPTRMGTRNSVLLQVKPFQDHPHAYGDKDSNEVAAYKQAGSSPRVWGQVASNYFLHLRNRIIPTRMGTRLKKSRKIAVLQNQPLRFPLTFHRSFV